MAGLPKIGPPPHPSEYAALREYMRPKIMPFIEAKAWIHIIDPAIVKATNNIATGTSTWSGQPSWSGWARVQPIRNTVSTWRATNPTTTRIVQFWPEDFPVDQALDQKPGLRIAIENVAGGENNDPWLSAYQYVIVGALNSTQAWQRTIDAQVDLENRPAYDFTTWPKPPED